MARRSWRRGRGSRRDRDEYVEEYYEEYDDYDDDYYETEYVVEDSGNGGLIGIIGSIVAVIFVVALLYFLFAPPSSHYSRPMPGYDGARRAQKQAMNLKPAKVGKPEIDLKAVEQALWQTKTDNPKDFKAWMKKFEDEVNAIYFATLKQQKPNADPTTLLPTPVRVEPKWENKLLRLRGYLDKNKQPGYQSKDDKLLFVFKQSQPYEKGNQKLSYSLYDSSGYYYRQPGYTHHISSTNAFFLGFFTYAAWHSIWWRPAFGWYGSPMWWRSGPFYSRYRYYYRSYPSYRGYYRTTYYRRYRPMGWSRGTYYRRGPGGRYYRRSAYRSGSRYRGRSGYRSGSSRYRSGSRGRSGYRSGGSRYRGRSGYRSGGSRYRSGGGYRSGYRSSGRSGGGKW